MKKQILVLGFFVFGFSCFAQDITEHGNISQMMDTYVRVSQSESQVQGWRIQIVTTNDRRKMENARAKFKSMYPEYNISWKHVSPYYQVKIGAYETKFELQAFLLELKRNFPSAIPVVDKIDKTELLK